LEADRPVYENSDTDDDMYESSEDKESEDDDSEYENRECTPLFENNHLINN
jgi:hypothetical protein